MTAQPKVNMLELPARLPRVTQILEPCPWTG